MANYNKVFDQKQYLSVANKAAEYFLERGKSQHIPLIVCDVPDAKQYTYISFNEPRGTESGIEWVSSGAKMSVRSNWETFDLLTFQGLIQISNRDIANFGASFIADKHEAEIGKLVYDVDYGMFHGPKDKNGDQLQEGLIGMLTSSIDLSSANGHDVSTKGEIWHTLRDLMEEIPFAIREQGPDMVLYINEKCYSEASAPDRIYNDKVEWNFIYDQFIGPQAIHGRKIGTVVITNMINAEASDNTDGNNADTVDTLGTHGRMLLLVPDKRWVARVISRGFSLIGEEQHMLHVDQLYGFRGRCIPFVRGATTGNAAVRYTEGLTF